MKGLNIEAWLRIHSPPPQLIEILLYPDTHPNAIRQVPYTGVRPACPGVLEYLLLGRWGRIPEYRFTTFAARSLLRHSHSLARPCHVPALILLPSLILSCAVVLICHYSLLVSWSFPLFLPTFEDLATLAQVPLSQVILDIVWLQCLSLHESWL
jgi:hypothetical protein